jgi:hypothetical protein
MKGRLIATAATAAALALAPAAAASAAYPPGVITCTINIIITRQGIFFTLTCSGFIPFNTARITVTSHNPSTPDSAISIGGSKSADIAVSADGTASVRVGLTAPGLYDVTVTQGEASTTQTITVPAVGTDTGTAAGGLSSATGTAAGVGTAAGGLSSTGTDVLPLAAGAGAVLLVGTGAVVIARQRRRTT